MVLDTNPHSSLLGFLLFFLLQIRQGNGKANDNVFLSLMIDFEILVSDLGTLSLVGGEMIGDMPSFCMVCCHHST